MFRIFKNIRRQLDFNKAFQQAVNLSQNNQKEKALDEFMRLIDEQPTNPYLRHKILMLSKELNKPVKLPEIFKKNNP